MGLRLFYLPNFPGAIFFQGGTFIPDSRVHRIILKCYLYSKMCRYEWKQSTNHSKMVEYSLPGFQDMTLWTRRGKIMQL
jgi:hypothetical protein